MNAKEKKKKKGYWELNDKEAEECSFRGGGEKKTLLDCFFFLSRCSEGVIPNYFRLKLINIQTVALKRVLRSQSS